VENLEEVVVPPVVPEMVDLALVAPKVAEPMLVK
jgi:hypothetical protein